MHVCLWLFFFVLVIKDLFLSHFCLEIRLMWLAFDVIFSHEKMKNVTNGQLSTITDKLT